MRQQGGNMVAARRGATVVQQETEFPTEWTMVDDGANLREEPQEEKIKIESEAGSETVKTPLAAQAHA